MKENIGKVVLDYKFYPGQDLYSDGKVEEELLEISKNYKESELNQVIAERGSWPVLYHFSHVRENIVNWLPIKPNQTVLEIGSGCGAITGALAKKAKKVTCIELSKQRSFINAYRHQECSNVEILLGNFQDVVNDLRETFDYITLIGVFEYSQGYIQTENPYADMLRKISPLLKHDGKLVIAIENRFGLKYWAGCTEDHVGRYFEGIEGYPMTKGVRTFSKMELKNIFEEVGGYTCQIYYPYPDYKFPTSIYSDKRLPAVGELKENNYNFDRERVRLFDETRVYDSLITNQLYGEFSNSFLLIATKAKKLEDFNTTYVKYSNERSSAFSLRTEICEQQNGNQKVFKMPESVQSKNHLYNIYDCYNKLTELYKNTPIRLNKCTKNSNCIELEFLKGVTLEELLDSYIEEKQYEKVWSVLESYLDVLKSVATVPFYMTEAFKKVFGTVDIPENAMCASVTNIDAICTNIIWGEETWQMLDYEWSFAFPIPVEFQIYRVLKYYLYTSTLRGCLHELDFFGRAGITEDKIEVYDEMEKSFQKYILGGLVPMRNMYHNISPGVLEDIKNIRAVDKKLRVYIDCGNDFSEDNSYLLPRERTSFRSVINIPKTAVRLRLDPCEESCLVYIQKLVGIVSEGEVDLSYISNGVQIADRTIFFDTSDPYFIIDKVPVDLSQIYAELEIQTMSTHGKVVFDDLYRKKQVITNENQILNQKYQDLLAKYEAQKKLINEMENTKVWKAYSFYKKRGK